MDADFLEFEQVYLQTLGRGIRAVAICAANSGEGVSTLACALAERHQRTGKSTLLVDMNLFRPSINQRFHLERTEWQTLEPSYSKALMTVSPGLDVLTASQCPATAFRELTSLNELFGHWLAHYDAVVVDTSPLNAINRHNVPAELVCAAAGCTLMMVKTGVTRQEELQQAISRLQAYQVNVFGVVMNDVAFPPLRSEMQRELARLHHRFPRLCQWLSQWIRQNHFINIRI